MGRIGVKHQKGNVRVKNNYPKNNLLTLKH